MLKYCTEIVPCSLLLIACSHKVLLKLLPALPARLRCQRTEGLLNFEKDLCICVHVWELGGIVALKRLMWRLMRWDNAGFVSLVPMSLVCSLLFSKLLVGEEAGGGGYLSQLCFSKGQKKSRM